MKEDIKMNKNSKALILYTHTLGFYRREKGITLIALVVTIVVLLILAAVSIATLTGENGLLVKAKQSATKTVNANVMEGLQLDEKDYLIDKNTGKISSTLIEYLQNKQIIGEEIGEGSGKYQINVEKLLGTAQKYGNGTATESEKKDVYILEKATEKDGKVTYKVIYYKTISESLNLGELIDIAESNWINFTIEGTQYQAEKGITWRQWVTEYKSDEFYIYNQFVAPYAGGEYVSTIEDANFGNGAVDIEDQINEGGVYYICVVVP